MHFCVEGLQEVDNFMPGDTKCYHTVLRNLNQTMSQVFNIS